MSFGQSSVEVEVTLQEPMLGTGSPDPKLYETYIASKSGDEDKRAQEVAVSERVAESNEGDVTMGTTVFPRDDEGHPFVWDYQIKGFLKGTCGALRKVDGTQSARLVAYKSVIDTLVFICEREVPILLHGEAVPDAAMSTCQRPLRADTAQGPRVTIASSEQVPAGCTLRFTVAVLGDGVIKGRAGAKVDFAGLLKEWLDYGRLSGLGQWRNSGMGRFTWKAVGDDGD